MIVQSLILLLWIASAHGDHRSGQRWARTTRTFQLGAIKSVTNSGPNDWLGNWDWAIDAWSQSKVFDLVTVQGETDFQTRLECPAKEGYIRVCNNDYGQTSWRGIARWSFQLYDGRPGLIYQCTVRLNDRTNTDYERKWLAHELGHCLGLDHTSTSGESDNSVMDYSVLPASTGPSPKDFAVLESVYSDIDWFDSAARLDPVSCPASKLEEVAAACSCDGPSPGYAWSNEQEYILCVDFIINDTGCNKQDVLDLAKCTPFDLPTASPTSKAPTESPTTRVIQLATRVPTLEPSELPSSRPIREPGERSPSNGIDPITSRPSDFPTRMPSPVPTEFSTANPSHNIDACSSILLAKLAQECDCFGPQPNQAWAVEDEYLQCLDFAARNTPCPVQVLIDRAGCLPFPIPTKTPTISPTLGVDDRLSTSTPSVGDGDLLSPTIAIDISESNAPTRPPTTRAQTIAPTRFRTKVPTVTPTKNPTSECSRAELARVSLQCNCNGRKNQKPWKHQREYERCVKKALEQSQCTFQAVMDATRCVVPALGTKRTKKNVVASSPNDTESNSACNKYRNENGCKASIDKCKWSKKENECYMTNRHRQLDMKSAGDNHHLHLPEKETEANYHLRAVFGQIYNAVTIDDLSLCNDRASFGVSPEATLVHAQPNSCRFAMLQSGGNKVDIVEVLL